MNRRSIPILLCILLLVTAPAWSRQDREDYAGESLVNIAPTPNAPMWKGAEGSILFDNGPLVNSVGTGVGGADESLLQFAALGMTTIGTRLDNRVGDRAADDLIVDDQGGWQLDSCTFFNYQTGAPNTSTITAVNLRIWDGIPTDPASNVIWGDTTTNRLASSIWSNIYRGVDLAPGDSERAVFATEATIGTILDPGTYWLDWSVEGSTSFSGPLAPPVTINGQTTTGNGLFNGTPFTDTATNTPQGYPFICNGQVLNINPVVEVPTLGEIGMLSLVLILGVAGLFRLRRS